MPISDTFYFIAFLINTIVCIGAFLADSQSLSQLKTPRTEIIMRLQQLLTQAINHHRRHELSGAEALYREVLAHEPGNASALNLLGLLAYQTGHSPAAQELIQQALAQRPDYAEAHNNLGMIYQDAGQVDLALRHYQQAVHLAPTLAEAHTNVGGIFQERGEPEQALIHYRQALSLQPNLATAHNNVGVIHLEQGRFADAITHFERATALDTRFAEAFNNLGNAHKCLGHFAEALNAYELAVSLDANFTLARWNRALIYLLQRNYNTGWSEYDWRLLTKEHFQRAFPYPTYAGESLAGKTLLIYAEQGIGDEIFFARWLPNVLMRCARVIVDCDTRLVPLLKRSFPEITFHGGSKQAPTDWTRDHAPIDFAISVGSLPRHFDGHNAVSALCNAYLKADRTRVAHHKRRLNELGAGLKVGISWRGGKTSHDRGERKTNLSQWQPLLSTPGIDFINLQYGDCSQDLAEVKQQLGVAIHHFADVDALQNIDEFAALVSSLDLVISIANANVHLAGALGQSVWAIIPLSPDFRWGTTGPDAPWYPHVELFRQRKLGEWESIIGEIAAQVQDLVRSRHAHTVDD